MNLRGSGYPHHSGGAKFKLHTVTAPSSGKASLFYLGLGKGVKWRRWNLLQCNWWDWTCNLSISSRVPHAHTHTHTTHTHTHTYNLAHATHTYTHTHSSSQSSLSSTPHAPRLKKPVLLPGPHHGKGGALPSTHELIKQHSYLDEGEVWDVLQMCWDIL